MVLKGCITTLKSDGYMYITLTLTARKATLVVRIYGIQHTKTVFSGERVKVEITEIEK